jgi:hypothetical protein
VEKNGICKGGNSSYELAVILRSYMLTGLSKVRFGLEQAIGHSFAPKEGFGNFEFLMHSAGSEGRYHIESKYLSRCYYV